MRKKGRVFLSLFLVLTFIFCSAVTPAAAETGSTTAILGYPCLKEYEISGNIDGMCTATIDGENLIFKNFPYISENADHLLLQIFSTKNNSNPPPYLYQQSTSFVTTATTNITATFSLQNFQYCIRENGQYFIEPSKTSLPSDIYEIQIYAADETLKFSVHYTTLYLITDGKNFGFAAPSFSNENREIYQKNQHVEILGDSYSSYLFNFYRNYNASSANLSGAEREAVQKTVDVLEQEFEAQNVTDNYTKVLAVHNLLAMVFHYDYYSITVPGPDGFDSAYRTIYEVLSSNRTVCEGYANVFSAMLSLMGIPNRTVHGYGSSNVNDTENSEFPSNHAWNEVYVNGRWMLFDVTWDSYNTYDYDPKTGKESWTYTDLNNNQVTTEAFDENSLTNRQIGTAYADCGMDLFSTYHRINEYITPKNSYRQWVFPENSSTPITVENTEDCYFTVNAPNGFANGTSLENIEKALPSTVTKVTPTGEKTVQVDWLTQFVKKYDSTKKGAQSFEISGAVYDKENSYDYKQIDITVTVLAEAPNAPVVIAVDKNSITVKEVTDAEYSCDGGLTWQESNVFTGLTPNTSYNLQIRTVDIIGSTPSQTTAQTTLKNYTKGDADEDGVVTLKDAYVIGLYVAGYNPVNFYKPAACYTSKDEPTLKDAAAIMRTVLK